MYRCLKLNSGILISKTKNDYNSYIIFGDTEMGLSIHIVNKEEISGTQKI